ncbi:hypothetical protein MKW92_005741 [Papaver armeniacum]|nr:hypothetical protein MKW92_005741 [Papaver armeniacum]
MQDPEMKHNIRNVSIIAHIVALLYFGYLCILCCCVTFVGKSTLVDCLVSAAGISAQESPVAATHADDAERGITTTLTAIALCFTMSDKSLMAYKGDRVGNEFLVNLVDSPGCVDLSCEDTADTHISDGALVAVDCVEGVCVQTETILRQALGGRIRPVLTVNKVDRLLLELQVSGEEAYQILSRVIQNTNAIMATYEDPLHEVQVYPDKGMVAFSAGLHGWGFTLNSFATLYASKFGVDISKMMERLWGENFFDPATKRWTTYRTTSATCKRGFVQFCYEPIRQIIATCINGQKHKLWPMLAKLGVALKNDEKDLIGKPLMTRVMQTWLPVATALLEMVIIYLPSPSTAQKYRFDNLYEGPLNDRYANAIRNCDARGPMMVYVSKIIRNPKKGALFAFGRVFAGSISTGSNVRILGHDHVAGQKTDKFTMNVQKTLICVGRKHQAIESVICGNLVLLIGLDKCISRTATLTGEFEVNAYHMRTIKTSLFPVVRVRVEVKVASDLPTLLKGIQFMKRYFSIEVSETDLDGCIIGGAGELYIKNCLKELQEMFLGGIEIVVSDPIAVFRETVLQRSDRMAMNKCNGLCMEARPLEALLVFGRDMKLSDEIWSLDGFNLLMNSSKGVQHLNQVKDPIIAGFHRAAEKGILADEHMMGICVEVSDGTLHAGATHRGGVLDSAAVSSVHASVRRAAPRLLEPVYMVEVLTPMNALGTVYTVINGRQNCQIFQQNSMSGDVYSIKFYLSVRSSLGFFEKLRTAMSDWILGVFFLSLANSRFRSEASLLVEDIRKFKRLSPFLK